MSKKNLRCVFYFLLFATFYGTLVSISWAQGQAENIQPYVETVQKAGQGMTLWEIIRSGGVVMIILGILSLLMMSLVIYLFIRLDSKKLVPEEFSHTLIHQLSEKNFDMAKRLCKQNENITSTIILSGLQRMEEGVETASEAIEVSARKEVTSLWSSLNYLADIAQIAPMLGLLGTVLGMIQAFNTIAFEAAVVKPILLAGGVSKAMVTTAGGLTIAIIAIVFYSFFRFRVQHITNLVETHTHEILEALRS